MDGLSRRIGTITTGRWGARLVVLGFLAVVGAVFALGATATSADPGASNLPSSVESVRAAELQRRLPTSQVNPALVVVARAESALTPADRAAVGALTTTLTAYAMPGQQVATIPSADGRAVLVSVPLSSTVGGDQLTQTVKQMRAAITAAGLPEGLTAQLTGGPGIAADISSAFDGADVKLLATTAGIVALLLLLTYRSPVLWVIPLAVVGIADQLGARVTQAVGALTGLSIDPASTGIASVLVFGAGTNYALLLIARYRETLRHEEDHRVALRLAVGSAGGAVIGSATTVTLSLLTLLLATGGDLRTIGWTSAVGVVVVLVSVLLVLPAALALCGRRLFWPFIPRVGSDDPSHRGAWARIADQVTRRPALVSVLAVVILLVLTSGIVGARIGLSQTEQFRVQSQSSSGLETIAAHYPAGSSAPARIIASAGSEQAVLAAATATPGVVSARTSDRGDGLVQVDAVLRDLPGSEASYDTVRALRDHLRAIPGADAVVGGSVAGTLDAKDAAGRDQAVIAPLILLVVLVILIVLLRSLVAPLLLIGTVVLSCAAALGAGQWAFTHVFDFPALDTSVPLLAFLFLVALGVDYNIFLTTRARQEAERSGTARGIRRAVAVTGGVITSAGVLLAAVFTVLGVLPLITLTQIGIIVGFGVLLDTLLVRTVLVPALVTMLGRRVWWPSELGRTDGAGPGSETPEVRWPEPAGAPGTTRTTTGV
ncbi:MAG: MMPL family transporter [Lapillicoccus sp.]